MDSRKILSKIAYYYVAFTKKTLRLKSIDLVGRFKEQSVYALWHGEQILPLCLNSGRQIVAMCSMSKDGEIQAGVLRDFGFIAVRGSTSKRAERALIETIRYARKGHFVAFTVDGPKGPVYKVKSGLLLVSQKIGIRLIPISAIAKNSLTFVKSWDKFKVPLPFSRTVAVYGNPIKIDKQDNLEEKALIVEKELNKLSEFANKYYWSKDINEYLSHHPKPKFFIKCKNNINVCIDKINELKQKYPLSQFTLFVSNKVKLNIPLPQDVSVVNKITSDLKKEFFDVCYGTSFFDNLCIKPNFKMSL
ncbi:MAG: lysophospholipid acyltransferase family protein [Elusimicrobia bacterium]|nr:lysophospholipid acyltransferase family protein [Elusimicrobiota bacterium]